MRISGIVDQRAVVDNISNAISIIIGTRDDGDSKTASGQESDVGPADIAAKGIAPQALLTSSRGRVGVVVVLVVADTVDKALGTRNSANSGIGGVVDTATSSAEISSAGIVISAADPGISTRIAVLAGI